MDGEEGRIMQNASLARAALLAVYLRSSSGGLLAACLALFHPAHSLGGVLKCMIEKANI